MFGAPVSNPTPASEETMEADGNNISSNLFAAPGELYFVFCHFFYRAAVHFFNCRGTKTSFDPSTRKKYPLYHPTL